MRRCIRLDGGARPDVFDLAGLPNEIAFSEADSEASRMWRRGQTRTEKLIAKISRHKAGPKNGSGWSPAIFKGRSRRGADAEQVSLGVFDCDRGQPLHEIRASLFVAGYAALIVPSYSHGATRTLLAGSKWIQWKEENQGATAAQYMRQRGYHDSVYSGAHVVSENDETVVIEHAPCSRYRVVLFPQRIWTRDDYADATDAEREFKSGLLRVATRLNLRIDTNCLDLPRLFFDPRYDPKGEKPVSYFVHGGCVDLWDPSRRDTGDDATPVAIDRRADPQEKCFSSFEELEKAVRAVANDERFLEYGDWRNFGAAIHYETDGSAEGLELWQEWSATWAEGGNDPEVNERVWRSFRRRK